MPLGQSVLLLFHLILGKKINAGKLALSSLAFILNIQHASLFKKGVDDSNSGDFTSVPCRKHSRMIK
jgi:hypothetical protein